MSEDKLNVNDDNDLKKEIEQLKREKSATELKLRRSDEQLYDEEYLTYLQDKKGKQQPRNSFMSGGRLSDYSDEEMQNLPVSKLAMGIRNEVYEQLKADENKKTTLAQSKAHKKKVADTRIEIKEFAKDHPDFWNYAAKIDELADENPKLNTSQLYQLAGGKLDNKEPPEKKQEPKKPTPPNTRPGNEAGMKQSDKNLSRREIIAQEYQKLK